MTNTATRSLASAIGLLVGMAGLMSGCGDDHAPVHPGSGGGGGEPLECAEPELGCACADEAPSPCYLEPRIDELGSFVCGVGTRTCRDGAWSSCEGVESYRIDVPKNLGARSVCNPCNPGCFEQTTTPTASDLPGRSDECIFDPSGPGVTVETSGPSVDTGLEDADGDGVPNLIDECVGAGWRTPCNGSSTIATEGFAFVLAPGDVESDPYPTVSLRLNTVDYYVLIDTTTSMTEEIARLQSDLITNNFLGASPPAGCSAATHPGILGAISCRLPNTAFGIGMAREYPRNNLAAEDVANGLPNNNASSPTAGADDVPFHHLLDITTDFNLAQKMVDALDINSQGYAQWYPESTGQALYSLATGLGLGPWVPTRGACANGGSGYACFRDGSIPIILVITDAPIQGGPSSGHSTGTYYPYDTWARTPTVSPNTNVPASALSLPAAITTDTTGRTVQQVLDLGNAAEFDLGNITSRSVTVLGTTENSTNNNNFSSQNSLKDLCYGQGNRAPYFKFTLTSARTIRIDTNSTDFDTVLALLTKSGTTYSRYNASSSSCNDNRADANALVSPEGDKLYQRASYLRFVNLPAGTYYVAVDEKGTADERGAFQLRIFNEGANDLVASEHTAVPWADITAALTEVGAKTIGIAVCDGAPSPTSTQCPDAQADLRQLGRDTGSVDASGEPFVTLGNASGVGLSQAVVDATLTLANNLRLDVGVECVDNPGTAANECQLFAVQGVPSGGACPVSCIGGRIGNTCSECAPGTAVNFDVHVTNVGVAQTAVPQVFEFHARMVAAGSELGRQPVRVLVPGHAPAVQNDGWFEVVYDSSGCNVPDQRPDWNRLDYDLVLPAGSKVQIELRTAQTLAALASATPVTVTTMPGSLAPDPLDVGAALAAAGQLNNQLYLAVRFHLFSSTTGNTAPLLRSFTTEYVCFDYE